MAWDFIMSQDVIAPGRNHRSLWHIPGSAIVIRLLEAAGGEGLRTKLGGGVKSGLSTLSEQSDQETALDRWQELEFTANLAGKIYFLFFSGFGVK
jgi:hypothetical protein